ncbi:hypothetical protein C8R41DRAFT_862994 [Lentinula lateritia]|uniref:UBA domain-containing protein n=1 Tax=Lentinula lateritia TaxID=40482 RepID=A0ABQ8VX42_9AGAR|nr:hypothetical protein C8R41DRAFT_862994 [Lentinula lateritia]
MSITNNSTKPYKLSNYYATLALGYNELTLYQEAEAIATRALQLSPTSYRARYNRAISRWKMDDLRGAIAGVLSIDGLPEDVTTKPSRDSTFTLQLQWWNDPARIQEVRDLMEARNTRRKLEYNTRVENATEDAVEAGASAGPLQMKEKEDVLANTQAQTTNSKNKQFYMSTSEKKSIGSNTKEKERKKEKKHKARAAKRTAKRAQTGESATPDCKKTSTTRTYYPESKTIKSLKKLANCGFTNDEVVYLMEFGVNPWDEDVHSVFAYVDEYCIN